MTIMLVAQSVVLKDIFNSYTCILDSIGECSGGLQKPCWGQWQAGPVGLFKRVCTVSMYTQCADLYHLVGNKLDYNREIQTSK